jgi:hypothetical protein
MSEAKREIQMIDIEAQHFVKAAMVRADDKGLNRNAFLMTLASYCVQRIEADGRDGLALEFCKFLVSNIENHGQSMGVFFDKKGTH